MNNIDHLKQRLDPMEIIEALGLDYSHENGSWLMCHCPFIQNHENGDQNPSFGFNSETFNWNCFVCGGGSLVELVRTQLDLSTKEAIWFLENLAAIEPQDSTTLVDKVTKIMNPPTKVEHPMPVFSAGDYWDSYCQLKDRHIVESFLKGRDIDPFMSTKFSLGFDDKHYGITIPHFFNGVIVGWQTRHLVTDSGNYYCDVCAKLDKTAPKYVNTPNFPKLNTLYRYDDVAKSPDVLVVESPMSAIYLHSIGIKNVVATFGSFSLEQAELLKKFSKIRIWPDNDEAGMKNLYRVLDDLRKATEVVIVPVVNKKHGDAADLTADAALQHVFAAYPPTILSLFNGALPTLEQVQTVL